MRMFSPNYYGKGGDPRESLFGRQSPVRPGVREMVGESNQEIFDQSNLVHSGVVGEGSVPPLLLHSGPLQGSAASVFSAEGTDED